MSLEKGQMRLGDLAQQAGIPPRTVRYYVQRGLLPAPRFRGPDTAYEEEHLLRLRAIRRLQERFFPLDAIQVELGRLTPEAIRALAEGGEPPPLVAAMAPAAAPASAVASASTVTSAGDGTAWERWELAPGLELHLSQAAGAPSRTLAEKLRDVAKSSGRERSNEH
jgi:DNA-binding transcriptional MerR regulator